MDIRYQISSDKSYYIVTGIGVIEGDHLRIPAEFNGLPVKEIGAHFSLHSHSNPGTVDAIKSIELPDTITRIGEQAFRYFKNLESIKLSSSLKYIERYAFTELRKLKSIEIPDSVKKIGEFAFMQTGIVSADLGKGVESIGNEAFASCHSLKEITIPSSVENLGNNVFEDCKALTAANLEFSLDYIPDSLFENCTSLSKINIPTTVKKIGRRAFYN